MSHLRVLKCIINNNNYYYHIIMYIIMIYNSMRYIQGVIFKGRRSIS